MHANAVINEKKTLYKTHIMHICVWICNWESCLPSCFNVIEIIKNGNKSKKDQNIMNMLLQIVAKEKCDSMLYEGFYEHAQSDYWLDTESALCLMGKHRYSSMCTITRCLDWEKFRQRLILPARQSVWKRYWWMFSSDFQRKTRMLNLTVGIARMFTMNSKTRG